MSVLTSSKNNVSNVAALPAIIASQPKIVFTDVDDTLTCDGRLPNETYGALYQLQKGGFEVVPVTGASAGWCDCIIKTWPVNHIIGENGALTMERDERGVVSTQFAKSDEDVKLDFAELMNLGESLSQRMPQIRFTQDQPYRVTDIAFDIGQTVTVEETIAEEAKLWLLDKGAKAKRSSIHINAWIGEHSKASGALRWLAQRDFSEQDCLFIGDSPNDESMFQQFQLSVGVANIQRFLPEMKYRPRYITNGVGGFGFVELANALLNANALSSKA